MLIILHLHEKIKNLSVYIALSALKIYLAVRRKSVPAAELVWRINPDFFLNLVR
jgi:hypothetical protein